MPYLHSVQQFLSSRLLHSKMSKVRIERIKVERERERATTFKEIYSVNFN